MLPTPVLDLLEQVTEGEVHRSSPGEHPGGEWDPWWSLSHRQRRRLIGAGFARRHGLMPDRLADIITANHPGLHGEDPIDWYFRTALRAITERRQVGRRASRLRLALRHGHRSEYEYRTAQAIDAGHRSLWHLRKARGWES